MNSHYGMVVASAPPAAVVIAHGPEEFVRETLADWVERHPLGEFEEAKVLADVTCATRKEQ